MDVAGVNGFIIYNIVLAKSELTRQQLMIRLEKQLIHNHLVRRVRNVPIHLNN